jgi:large-conductance mechanosensitive channel
VLLHGDNLIDHTPDVPCPIAVYPERYYQSLKYVVLGDTLVKVETQTLCLEKCVTVIMKVTITMLLMIIMIMKKEEEEEKRKEKKKEEEEEEEEEKKKKNNN